MSRQIIRYWAPVAVWIGWIFIASTDAFSAQNTGSVIESIITAIVGHPLPPPTFEPLHFVIRKLAHVTEYAVLGALAFRAERGDRRGWSMRWAAVAVIISMVVAATDEFHQSFVPTRTPSVIDVGIDTVGATVAQLILRWWIGRRSAET